MRFELHLHVHANEYVTYAELRDGTGKPRLECKRSLVHRWTVDEAELWGMEAAAGFPDAKYQRPFVEIIHHKLDNALSPEDLLLERTLLLHTNLLREIEAELRRGSSHDTTIVLWAIGRCIGTLLSTATPEQQSEALDEIINIAKRYGASAPNPSQEKTNDQRQHQPTES